MINETTILNPVYQVKAHADTSKVYKFVSTADIKNMLQLSGFTVFKEQVARARKFNRQGFQRHTIKFIRTQDKQFLPGEQPNEHVVHHDRPALPMLILTNGHDGKTGIVLHGGFFRVMCSNGLVVAESDITPIHIRHTGNNVLQEVHDNIWKIVAQLELQASTLQAMKDKQLTGEQRDMLAAEALTLLPRGEFINPQDALVIRREGDQGNDLWTVFNRIQENVIQGGLRPEGGRKLRAVKSIERELELNKQLWTIATEYLKAA